MRLGKPAPFLILDPTSLSIPSCRQSVGLGGHCLPRNPLPGGLKSKDILLKMNLLC